VIKVKDIPKIASFCDKKYSSPKEKQMYKRKILNKWGECFKILFSKQNKYSTAKYITFPQKPNSEVLGWIKNTFKKPFSS